MKRRALLIAISALAVLGAAVWGVTLMFRDGELAQAGEWWVLQSLEFKYRGEANIRGVIVQHHPLETDYDALGFPLAESELGYAWLLANPSSKPKIKLMPSKAKFRLSRADLERVQHEVKMDSEVAAFLNGAAPR